MALCERKITYLLTYLTVRGTPLGCLPCSKIHIVYVCSGFKTRVLRLKIIDVISASTVD